MSKWFLCFIWSWEELEITLRSVYVWKRLTVDWIFNSCFSSPFSTDLLVRFNCTKHNYLLVLGPLNILWHKFVKVAYCIHAKAYLKRVETEVAEVRRTVCPLLAPAGWTHCVVCMLWESGSVSLFVLPGKRKALKLNFANPPVKPASRLPLNPTPPSFQNPHMWVADGVLNILQEKWLVLISIGTKNTLSQRIRNQKCPLLNCAAKPLEGSKNLLMGCFKNVQCSIIFMHNSFCHFLFVSKFDVYYIYILFLIFVKHFFFPGFFYPLSCMFLIHVSILQWS